MVESADSLSVCQSVSLSVGQSVSLSVCQSVSLSVCQSISRLVNEISSLYTSNTNSSLEQTFESPHELVHAFVGDLVEAKQMSD